MIAYTGDDFEDVYDLTFTVSDIHNTHIHSVPHVQCCVHMQMYEIMYICMYTCTIIFTLDIFMRGENFTVDKLSAGAQHSSSKYMYSCVCRLVE